MQQLQEATVRLDNSAGVLIAEHVRRLLAIMGVGAVQVFCSFPEEEVLLISVATEDSGSMLIGPQGAHLYAFQHLLRCMLKKGMQLEPRILVDVNGYRARRERGLVGLAEETARKAQKSGRAVELTPMNAVDRRAIHTALAGHKEVRTESLGEGVARRVVVRPVFL